MLTHLFKTTIKQAAGIFVAVLCSSNAFATTVQFQTNMGDFEVALFDEIAPASVSNFLTYVNSGAYKDNVVHRSEPGFVVQAGGVAITQSTPLMFANITTNPPVKNEPKLSNLRGTLAYAKQAGKPNSATSQWFFNIKNNSSSLDYAEQGYTVFGQVINNGMTIVDAINALKVYDLQSNSFPFASVPLIDADNTTKLTEDNLVVIYNIVVLDADPQSSANLTPATIKPKPSEVKPPESSGGQLSTVFLLLLAMAVMMRFGATKITSKKD